MDLGQSREGRVLDRGGGIGVSAAGLQPTAFDRPGFMGRAELLSIPISLFSELLLPEIPLFDLSGG